MRGDSDVKSSTTLSGKFQLLQMEKEKKKNLYACNEKKLWGHLFGVTHELNIFLYLLRQNMVLQVRAEVSQGSQSCQRSAVVDAPGA